MLFTDGNKWGGQGSGAFPSPFDVIAKPNFNGKRTSAANKMLVPRWLQHREPLQTGLHF